MGGLLSVPLEGHKVIRQCQCQNLKIREIPWKNVIFASVIRESLGTSIYFATYYWKQPVYREEPIKLFLWGGFSGWLSWLFSYPFDTYKTRFQTNVAQTWKQAIMKQPYMGFAVFSLRCFIVNAVGLTTYEKITS